MELEKMEWHEARMAIVRMRKGVGASNCIGFGGGGEEEGLGTGSKMK